MTRPPLTFKNGVARNPETGRYHVRVMAGGRLIQKVMPTKKAAAALVRDLKVERVRSSLGLGPSVTSATIKQVVDDFIKGAEARGVMESTAGRYRGVGRILKEVLGPNRSARLTNSDITKYVAARRDSGVGGKSIASELALLRTFIRGTIGPAFIEWVTPTLFDPNQAAPKQLPTDTEVAGLLWVLREKPPWNRLILLALLTALRPGDALRVSPKHLHYGDDGEPLLAVPMSKRRGQVIVLPVVPRLAVALEGVEGATYGPTVKSYQAFQAGLRHHTKALKKPWHGPQILRVTASSWASEAGFTDEQVGILLGHKVRGMAREHYIRPAADPWVAIRRKMLEAVAARLELAEAEFANHFGTYEKHIPESAIDPNDQRVIFRK